MRSSTRTRAAARAGTSRSRRAIHPEFDATAAFALLDAARDGATGDAEEATGYRWGEPRLHPHVTRLLARARIDGDERLEQLAERFLW